MRGKSRSAEDAPLRFYCDIRRMCRAPKRVHYNIFFVICSKVTFLLFIVPAKIIQTDVIVICDFFQIGQFWFSFSALISTQSVGSEPHQF